MAVSSDLGHLAGNAVLLQLLILTPQLTFSPGSPISPGCPCKTKYIHLPATSPPSLPPFSCLRPQNAAPHGCLNGSPCKVPLPHLAVPFNSNPALFAFLLNNWVPPPRICRLVPISLCCQKCSLNDVSCGPSSIPVLVPGLAFACLSPGLVH